MTTIVNPRAVGSLARAELIMLGRNKLLSFNALQPVLCVLMLIPLEMDADGVALALTVMIAMLLLFVVYYNMLSALVTRRDELVLKRLRAGESSDATILAGMAVPSMALVLVEIVVLVIAGAIVLDLDIPQNPVLLVAAVIGGAVVFVALAITTSSMTRTAESAQLTSAPVIFLSLGGAVLAATAPADFPELVLRAAEITPLVPVITLASEGWVGSSVTAMEPWRAALVIACWIALGAYSAANHFRWEPRM